MRRLAGWPAARSTGGLSNNNFSPLPAGFTFYIPMYVTTDARNMRIEYGNSFVGYDSSANFADITPAQVAMYTNDGSDGPLAIIAASKQTGITAPGNGALPYVSPAFDPTSVRGGKAIVCYTAPAGSQVGLCMNQQWGMQSASGASVDPLPGGFSAMTNPIGTVRLHYETARPCWFSLGHSIPCGYSAVTAVGKGNSAWYRMGITNDYAVDVSAIPQATFTNWLSRTGQSAGNNRPYFWPTYGRTLRGKYVGICLGANDLIGGRTALQMKDDANALCAELRRWGVKGILIETITPGASWVAADAERVTYNAYSAAQLGADLKFDTAAIVAKVGTPSQLADAYADTGAGATADHLSVAGMDAVLPSYAAACASLVASYP